MGENSSLDTTTIRENAAPRPTAAQPGFPTLTILWHAEPARVGEMAQLGRLPKGKSARLSRLEPEFAQPGHVTTRPLESAHVSRQPVKLTGTQNGIRIEPDPDATEIAWRGEPLTEAVELDADALRKGVVLTLGTRIVLLLHLRNPPAGRTAETHGLVGDSDAVAWLRGEIERVADLDVAILLRGETGVGKERVAEAIHRAGPRRRSTFVPVNMAAIPAPVAASQLFGHNKGAFTGAAAAHRGFFSQADGGTLFLDEVGETPGDVQPMLLRALEDQSIQPLGAQASTTVDVRLIAATDADLEQAAEAGTFKSPLLHRLAGYQITIPPLAERRDDVGRLLVHFLREESSTAGEPDRVDALSAFIVAQLATYDWPGNVRELRNVARHLVISNRGADELTLDAFLTNLLEPDSEPSAPASTAHPRVKPSEITQEMLIAALRDNRWRTGATAATLGISRTSLYSLMDRCQGIRKAKDISAEEIEECLAELNGDLDLMSERLQVSKRGLQLRMKELGCFP